MSKKAFRTTVLIFLAAISATVVLLFTLPALQWRQYTAVLIPMTTQRGFEFWEFVERGAREGAREFGVDLAVTGPEREDDTDGQVAAVYEAISRKPDFIILAPSDARKLAEPAQAVRDAGISLILIDCSVATDDPTRVPADCFVGIDNRQAGRILAGEMGERLPDGGEVAVLVDLPGSTTATDRVAGLLDGLEAYPKIHVVEIAESGSSVEASKQRTEQLLADHPDLRGIFGTNPVSSEGAARALRERNDPEHVHFFAFDTSTAMNEFLEDGTIDGFVAQIAFNLGYLSVDAGYLACRDQLRTSTMDSGYVYATKENMREEHIRKLIYPFV